ncbi:MAG: hypothetical protein QGF65_02425 [Candidatus Pelagibacter bacterium]|jgi:hypothetical protein|nr:hypothetical protein [Candidatus Pelagibacter bacterium]|tara:strand:- start:216 stop:674 length:459 start_codon:yes stop_codon:yes gene_type:complete
MKLKNKILIFFFIFIFGCGYQPIFSDKNIKFSIGQIDVNKNDKLNRVLLKNLENYKKTSKGTKLYDLIIATEYKKFISSKDTKGNPKTFRMEITNELKVLSNNELMIVKIFKGTQNYDNKVNKFELKQYEENTTKNLIEKISGDIIIFLQTL